MNKRIIQLRKQGLNNSEIAKRCDMTRDSVRHQIESYEKIHGKIFSGDFSRKKITDEEIMRVTYLRKDGLTIKEIAKQLNMSYKQVEFRFRKLKERNRQSKIRLSFLLSGKMKKEYDF